MNVLMINRLKSLRSLSGKKRYLVLGFLAVELMSLPAAAQIVKQVSFSSNPTVTAVEIPTREPGLSRYLVTSNAEFYVTVDNMVGVVDVNLHVSGTFGGNSRFGDAAQLPGPKSNCAETTALSSIVYDANRETAAKDGTPPEQAVVFELRYAPNFRPEFEFIAGEDITSTLIQCEQTAI